MKAEMERLVVSLEKRTETKDNYRIALENGRWEAAQLIRRLLARSDWIPVSERLPDAPGWYLVTRRGLTGRDVGEMHWSPTAKWGQVIAWQDLPAPYRAEGADQ